MRIDLFHRDQDGADALREGHFLMQRRRARRVDVPVRIFFGPPIDPETGDELDRSPRWQMFVAGALLDTEPLVVGGVTLTDMRDVWPACATDPIDEDEYRYRLELQAWAAENEPDSPFAVVGGRIDPMSCPLPFA